jgi:hypothetical protein
MYIGSGILGTMRRVPVNRIRTVIAMTGVIFVGAQAFAHDFINPPTMSKRQMIVQIVGCMKKRMSANKTISYNEAATACKDQIHKQRDNTTLGTLVASDTPAKP